MYPIMMDDDTTSSSSVLSMLSLPNIPKALIRKIGDFSSAYDILALSTSCRSIYQDLSISVLKSPYEISFSELYNGSPPMIAINDNNYHISNVDTNVNGSNNNNNNSNDDDDDENDTSTATTTLIFPIRVGASIPTIFPKSCHSIRITAHWSDQGTRSRNGRFFIVAEPNQAIIERIQKDNNINGDNSDIPFSTKVSNLVSSKEDLIKNEHGNEAVIIWKSDENDMPETTSRQPTYNMDVTFQYDDTQNYHLWYQCGGPGHLLMMSDLRIERILVWDDKNRCRKRSYEFCMQLDKELDKYQDRDNVQDDMVLHLSRDYDHKSFVFLAQLFALSVACLEKECISAELPSETSNPIQMLFESRDNGIGKPLHSIHVNALKQVASIYQQLVQPPTSSNKFIDFGLANLTSEELQPLTLPPILLRNEVAWNVNIKNLTSETPLTYIVARIPMIPGISGFYLSGNRERLRRSPNSLDTVFVFVMTAPITSAATDDNNAPVFQESDLSNGYKIIVQKSSSLHFEQFFEVDPEAEAYYLCVFPHESSIEELGLVEVQYSLMCRNDINTAQQQDIISSTCGLFFGLLGAQSEQTTYESSFHLALFRAAVQYLLSAHPCDGEINIKRKRKDLEDFFESEGLPTTKNNGLEILAKYIDDMLQARNVPSPIDMTPDRGNLLYRTYGVM